MDLLLPLVLLAVGVAAGWLLRGRRSAAAAPDEPAATDGQSGARWHADVRAIADAASTFALIIDSEGTVVHVNESARSALPAVQVGTSLAAISPPLAELVRRAVVGDDGASEERVFLGEPPRSLNVITVAFAGGVLASLYDVTEDVDFDEARRTFSAAVSHELRTPLARILGLAESLGLPNTDDEREELVTQIEHEVDGMRQLIDEMLLLAALDRGRLAVIGGVVDAGGVASDIVEAAKQRRIGRGRDITCTVTGEVDVPVAQRLFEVVVQNLVDNALIHGGPAAAVLVSVRAEGDDAVITVADTGIGIASQHLPFVFQRFYRGEASRTGPGSGLGLALVKHIVEAHGGAVTAESDGTSGTLLRVTLPRVS